MGVGASVAGGAVGGAVSGAIGVGGAAAGAAGGATSGFINGAGNSWLQGNDFGEGITTGLKSVAIGGVAGGAIGGVVSGVSAYRDYRNFWNGKPNVYHADMTYYADAGSGGGQLYNFPDNYTVANSDMKNVTA